jgi:hypothetical protein
MLTKRSGACEGELAAAPTKDRERRSPEIEAPGTRHRLLELDRICWQPVPTSWYSPFRLGVLDAIDDDHGADDGLFGLERGALTV